MGKGARRLGTGCAQAVVSTVVFLFCGAVFSHPETKAYLDLQAGPNGEIEAELGVPNALTSTIANPTFKTARGPCTADVVTRRVLGPPTRQNQTSWRVQCPAAPQVTVEFPGLGAPVMVSLAWRDKTQTKLLNPGSGEVTLKAPGLGVRPKTSANPPVKSPAAAAPADTPADKKLSRQTRWSIAAGLLALLIFVIAIVRGR